MLYYITFVTHMIFASNICGQPLARKLSDPVVTLAGEFSQRYNNIYLRSSWQRYSSEARLLTPRAAVHLQFS